MITTSQPSADHPWTKDSARVTADASMHKVAPTRRQLCAAAIASNGPQGDRPRDFCLSKYVIMSFITY
jgi:hypothetical protein